MAALHRCWNSLCSVGFSVGWWRECWIFCGLGCGWWNCFGLAGLEEACWASARERGGLLAFSCSGFAKAARTRQRKKLLPLFLPSPREISIPRAGASKPVSNITAVLMATMNNDLGGFAGRPTTSQANPFESALYGAGPGLIRSGIGAYGEKFLGSSSEFMQSNITQYLSDPQYYFQVNNQYVRNKLKIVLFPFLHRGQWTRITEPVGGRLSYKPPVKDINAPDLYIPLMAFATYILVAGYALGALGRFTPEALTIQFTKGLLGWFMQVVLIKARLYTLGIGESPLLDIVAYAGYGFAGTSLAMLVRIFWSYSYYFVLPWFCICTGVFLVKTMKRVLLGASRSYERHPSRNHYFFLFLAIVQFPMLFWLGKISS